MEIINKINELHHSSNALIRRNKSCSQIPNYSPRPSQSPLESSPNFSNLHSVSGVGIALEHAKRRLKISNAILNLCSEKEKQFLNTPTKNEASQQKAINGSPFSYIKYKQLRVKFDRSKVLYHQTLHLPRSKPRSLSKNTTPQRKRNKSTNKTRSKIQTATLAVPLQSAIKNFHSLSKPSNSQDSPQEKTPTKKKAINRNRNRSSSPLIQKARSQGVLQKQEIFEPNQGDDEEIDTPEEEESKNRGRSRNIKNDEIGFKYSNLSLWMSRSSFKAIKNFGEVLDKALIRKQQLKSDVIIVKC